MAIENCAHLGEVRCGFRRLTPSVAKGLEAADRRDHAFDSGRSRRALPRADPGISGSLLPRLELAPLRSVAGLR